jgi:signal transduction histidine kinase
MIRRQRSLKLRAHLMQEAIRNHDFTFRLPTDGLLPGERAMQEALNQLGGVIRRQVNQSEVESWERLTRVLTHEMMNAIAPITSISQSMLNREDVKGTPLEPGIQAIYTASQHLSDFVVAYRKLLQLQQPSLEDVSLADFLLEIRQLYPSIDWHCLVADHPLVCADRNMLRQVLINLVKNAKEAGATQIGLEYTAPTLYVSNDGQPIAAEARQSIFVPFFTTKRRGSGIGLSYSRRLMLQQGGYLNLEDHPRTGYHTTFSVEFSTDLTVCNRQGRF